MKFSNTQRRKLTEQDIISNLIVLLIVGYDTTEMTLAAVLWALAENEQVQEKLQCEMDGAWNLDGGFLSYSSLQAKTYSSFFVSKLHSGISFP